MANEQNLRGHGFHERTAKEQREIAKKGGKASGKSRRKKADLKKAFETLLNAEVANETAKKQLESMGFEPTNEMAMAMVMMQKAMKGNVKAFTEISKAVAERKDRLDKKEQEVKVKLLETKLPKDNIEEEADEISALKQSIYDKFAEFDERMKSYGKDER